MVATQLFRNAWLKIDRAIEQIEEIEGLLTVERPFRYILETDAKAGMRATFAQRNEPVIDRVAIRCGEAIQSLGSALDYAYFDLVVPFVTEPGQQKNIQFPHSETAARLKQACQNRLAHKVSQDFLDAMVALAPHGENGGNELLYFMLSLNNKEKHVTLIPVGYYLKVVAGDMRKKIPDFMPGMSSSSDFVVAQNFRDFSWPCRPLSLNEWIARKVPPNGILHEEVDLPVEIFFEGRSVTHTMLAVPMLRKFVEAAKETVKTISKFS